MVRCTIYAQISVLVQKANGILMSPQWGDNSKEYEFECIEVIDTFQSPQWGDNSKVLDCRVTILNRMFQTPQWGNNSKVLRDFRGEHFTKFQSPQWSSTFTLLTQRPSIPIEVRLPISS